MSNIRAFCPTSLPKEQGVVAQGKLNEAGVFVASEVLAKHDENYMPPEAAKALEDAHKAGVAKAHAPGHGTRRATPRRSNRALRCRPTIRKD